MGGIRRCGHAVLVAAAVLAGGAGAVRADGPSPPDAALRSALADAQRALAELDAADPSDATATAVRCAAAARGVAAAFALGDADAFARFAQCGRARRVSAARAAADALRAAAVPDAVRDADAGAAAREAAAVIALRRARAGGRVADARAAARALSEARAARRAAAARYDAAAWDLVHPAHPTPAPLATIRSELAPGDVLVLPADAEGRARALVATRDGARLADLGPVEALDAAFAAAAEAVRSEATDAAATTALRDALAPLALPATARRVVLVPDARFADVPLAAAWPDVAVARWPSWTVARAVAASASRGDGVLALGDPEFPPASRGGLGRLPATRDEATAVGDEVLLGPAATAARLRERLASRPRWRALHLATHADAHGDDPRGFSVALTPEEARGDEGEWSVLEAVRAGVPADLLVLAGSASARTVEVDGDGPAGWPTEGLLAGARGVLGSVGAADEEATRVLFTRFHALWNPRDEDGLPAAEALRRAQAHVRAQEGWAHPRYWAGWVLWGDPD